MSVAKEKNVVSLIYILRTDNMFTHSFRYSTISAVKAAYNALTHSITPKMYQA